MKLSRNHIIIIAIVLVVIILIIRAYVSGVRSGSNDSFSCRWLGLGCIGEPSNGSANPGQANVPDVPALEPTVEIIALSNRLSQYINEWVLFNVSYRCTAYRDALELDVAAFKSLANYFKNTNNNTLREAIQDTNYGCNNFIGTDPKERMLIRLDELNIP